MAGDIIKEFLVKLGFKIDEDGVKKFQAGVASVTKEVTGLGLKAAGAATAVTAAITKIAEQYEDLYFASIRTGTSAAALSTFAYGSKAIGISAEQSASSLERLNVAMQANPGTAALLNRMIPGGIAGKDNTQILNSWVDTLAKMPTVLQQAYNSATGFFSPGELIQRIALRKDEAVAEVEHARLRKLAGIDLDELAHKSHDFDQALRGVETALGIGWDQVANRWLPSMTTGVNVLYSWEQVALGAGGATAGMTSSIIAFASALGAVKVAAALLPAGLAARLGLTTAVSAVGSIAVVPIAIGAGSALSLLNAKEEKEHPTAGRDKPDLKAIDKLPWYQQLGIATMATVFNADPNQYLDPTQRTNSGGGIPATSGGAFKSQVEKEAYIRQQALLRGINPDVAMKVAMSEGFSHYKSTIPGETSYGAFQLHYGGDRWGPKPGLGNAFTQQTGLDARNPETEKEQIDFALDYAKKQGWGPWHGWKGSQFAGIGAGGGETTVNVTQHNTFTGMDPKVAADHVSAGLSSWADATRTAGVTVR